MSAFLLTYLSIRALPIFGGKGPMLSKPVNSCRWIFHFLPYHCKTLLCKSNTAQPLRNIEFPIIIWCGNVSTITTGTGSGIRSNWIWVCPIVEISEPFTAWTRGVFSKWPTWCVFQLSFHKYPVAKECNSHQYPEEWWSRCCEQSLRELACQFYTLQRASVSRLSTFPSIRSLRHGWLMLIWRAICLVICNSLRWHAWFIPLPTFPCKMARAIANEA